jgi:hypothetical protein
MADKPDKRPAIERQRATPAAAEPPAPTDAGERRRRNRLPPLDALAADRREAIADEATADVVANRL